MDLFEGLRIIDLSTTSAGAVATQVLADHGAEVIHVERPNGSPLRGSPAHAIWARGKKSVVLDLADDDDRAAVVALAARSDVVVETFRPGVAERLGVGAEALRAVNPALVVASITGFGTTGPLRSVKGYEAIVAAKLGLPNVFRRMVARPGPAFVSVPFCSWSAGQLAVHGMIAALYQREATGTGQHVETSLAQGLAALDVWNWFILLVGQRYPDAFTGGPPFSDEGVPTSGFYFRIPQLLTSDGHWLQFGQTQPRLFRAFLRALGLEWMFDDPKWSAVPDLDDVEQRVELWRELIEAARSRSLAEWREVFELDSDVWAEEIVAGAGALDHPQLRHDGRIAAVTLADGSTSIQPGALLRVDGDVAPSYRRAPGLGEHDAEVRALLDEPVRSAVAAAPSSGHAPLQGVVVLELGTFYGGPFGATLLADLGARVIKVESIDGEPMRTVQAFPEVGAIKVLQGKESIAIDLGSDAGRRLVHELARRADVVLQSFRAGVAERLGVDAVTLRAVNPDLVYVGAYGYGSSGPCAAHPAFAPTIGAGSGMAMCNIGAQVSSDPSMSTEAVMRLAPRLAVSNSGSTAGPDGLAALATATAMLAGLFARRRGQGACTIETSMLGTAVQVLAEHVVADAERSAPSVDPELLGVGALYRLYEASDGWVFLAAPQSGEWPAVVAAFADHVDLARPGFGTADDRVANDTVLARVLADAFRTQPAGAWEQALLAHDVACVVVDDRPTEIVLMSDELGRASGFVTDVEHPMLGEHPRLASLVRFSDARLEVRGAPLLGDHTDAVLRELGCSDAVIDELRAAGSIL